MVDGQLRNRLIIPGVSLRSEATQGTPEWRCGSLEPGEFTTQHNLPVPKAAGIVPPALCSPLAHPRLTQTSFRLLEQIE